MRVSGALLFARYAWPPNELGYCGPASQALREQMDEGALDALAVTAHRFDGAFPYLQAIAASWGIGDPLDPRVVSAYWIGNDLLDTGESLGSHLEDRFRRRAGGRWDDLAAIADGMVPQHAHHVFCVYPWTGMLSGATRDPALAVLNRCRIRVGTVTSVDGGRVAARVPDLTWDGDRFGDEHVIEHFEVGELDRLPRPGDSITVHWGWVCDVVDGTAAARVAAWENRARKLAETRLRGLPLTPGRH